MSFVSHIECTVCGRRHEAGRVLSVCEGCGQKPSLSSPISGVQLKKRGLEVVSP